MKGHIQGMCALPTLLLVALASSIHAQGDGYASGNVDNLENSEAHLYWYLDSPGCETNSDECKDYYDFYDTFGYNFDAYDRDPNGDFFGELDEASAAQVRGAGSLSF